MSHKNSKFVALLSSGLDSPVALYLMMKKGYDALCLSFDVSNHQNRQFYNKILNIANHLAKLTSQSLTIYIINHQQVLQEFITKDSRNLTCILCKCYMLLSAYLLANQIHADFIVNGDILGEQASQTLDNIAVIQTTMPKIPIIRPLVGFEKADILKISHELGLYDFSLLSDTQCSFNPQFPTTHAQLNDVKELIKQTNLEFVARFNLKNAQVLIAE